MKPLQQSAQRTYQGAAEYVKKFFNKLGDTPIPVRVRVFQTAGNSQMGFGFETVTLKDGVRYIEKSVERKYSTGTMKHIYHGEINRRGKAVGYHHESMMGGNIVPGTEKVPDKNGVYEAKVEIDGKRKVAKSSFFPKEWNRVDVLKVIDEAYQNKKQIGSNKYIGNTSTGIKIEMFLNKDGSIATAYPLYNK